MSVAAVVAVVTAALAAFTYTQHDYTRAVEEAATAASEYSDAKTELESLNSEYEEQIATIEELQALKTDGSITLEQEAELENLLAENSALEAQLRLQESITAAKQQASATAAATAASTEQSYMEHMQEEYGTIQGWFLGLAGYIGSYTDPETGMVTTAAQEWNQMDTTESGKVETYLSQLEQYKERLAEVYEELKDDPTNEALLKEQENLQNSIAEVTQNISDSSENIQAWIGQCTDSNGNITKGYEEWVEEWQNTLTEIAKMDLNDLEKELYDIEDFFDGSTGSNFISDYLKDIAENGEITDDTLAELGLTIEDIGSDVSIETLAQYFEELTDNAETAEEAISSVAGTVESVEAAFETDNQNSDWETMAENLSKASDLYDDYQVGVDEFWEAAQFMTPDTIDTSNYLFDSDAYTEAWENAVDKVNRYFDSENPLKSASNFQEDLISAGLGTVLTDDYGEYVDWSDEFKSSADAADALGLSLEATEVLMHNLEAYGAEFDDIQWSGEMLDEYTSALEGIKSLYDSMDEGTEKDRLGTLIENWDEELAGYEDDLSSLTEEQIVHIEFEYDLASLQAKIDEVNALIEGGDASVQNYATKIAGNKAYISTAESNTGLADNLSALVKEGYSVAVSYKANQDSIDDLQNQLAKATTDEEKIELQAEIVNMQEIQKGINNAFIDAHPEINADSSIEEIKAAWADFSSNPQTIYVDAELSQEQVQEQLDSLVAGSSIVFDGTVTVDDKELSETIEAVKNEDGTITYKADIDGDDVKDELEAIENEDGTITFKADTSEVEEAISDIEARDLIELYAEMNLEDNEVGTYIEQLNEMQLDEKFVDLEANDQASGVIASINLLETNDKFCELTADEQVTAVVNMVNALSLDDKWSTLSVEDKATAMVELFNSLDAKDKTATITQKGAETTTELADEASAAIVSIPDANPIISATSNVSAVVSSSSKSLNSIDGKVARTYVYTYAKTITELGGTAHAGGTSKRKGYDLSHKDQSWIKPNWRTKSDEVALVGEENQELVATRDGYWYTVGENGAEFASIPKGSVVFDAHQTRRLLTNGFINERGKNLLGGTAFANGSRRLSSVSSSGSSSSSNSTSSTSSSKSSSSNTSTTSSDTSSSDDFEQEFNWIEVMLNRLQEAVERLKVTAESAFKKLSTKNSAAKKEIAAITDEIEGQTAAYEKYMSLANDLGLSSTYVEKIKNGTLDISTITDEDLADTIEQFQEYYEAAIECADAVAELHEEIAQLYLDQFDNVADDYDNQLELLEHMTNTFETGIDTLEEKGYFAASSYYKAMQQVEESNISTLEKKLADLTSAFSEAMNSGEIEENSEAWYENALLSGDR